MCECVCPDYVKYRCDAVTADVFQYRDNFMEGKLPCPIGSVIFDINGEMPFNMELMSGYSFVYY